MILALRKSLDQGSHSQPPSRAALAIRLIIFTIQAVPFSLREK